MLEGIDTIHHIPASVLQANGKKFVCRYLPIPGKTNSAYTTDRNEVATLRAAGIHVVLNHETTGKTYRGGRNAGITDAREAQAALTNCGVPDAPCIFSVDEDTSNFATINDWLDGCSSVLGRNRVGLYHKYESIRSALEGNHATYGWQTYAWSRGQFYDRCHIYQYSNDRTISGFSCDLNRTVVSDTNFGQVGASVAPQPSPPPARKDIPQVLKVEAGEGVSIPVRGFNRAFISGPNVPVSWNISGRTGDDNGSAGWQPYEFPIQQGDYNLWIQNKGDKPVVLSFMI